MSPDDTSGFLRRAGIGTLPDGSVVTWSVAEGTRGRRWRWTLGSREALRYAGLIELDVEGRFRRLELETGEGMLTLHPTADRQTVHGNVVRAGGVDPIEVAWSDDDAVAIDGDPFGSDRGGLAGEGLDRRRSRPAPSSSRWRRHCRSKSMVVGSHGYATAESGHWRPDDFDADVAASPA